MFVSSFYCFLNYNSKSDFVIDLDNVWEWLGFKQKVNAKTLLENHFKINIDYIKLQSELNNYFKMIVKNTSNYTICKYGYYLYATHYK